MVNSLRSSIVRVTGFSTWQRIANFLLEDKVPANVMNGIWNKDNQVVM